MGMIDFDKETISMICEKHDSDHPDSLLLELYKHVYGKTWKKIKYLIGYPKVSKTTAEFILGKMQNKCSNYKNELMMIWVDKGFGIDENIMNWKLQPAKYELF